MSRANLRECLLVACALLGCPQGATTRPDGGLDGAEDTREDDRPNVSDEAMDASSGTDLSSDPPGDMAAVDAPGDRGDARGEADGVIDSPDGGRDAALDESTRIDGDVLDDGGSRDAPTERPPHLDPIYATEPVPVAHIMAGGGMFLATARDGMLWGWGDNWEGWLQPAALLNSTEYRSRPQRVDGVRDVRELLSMGGAGLCVLAGAPPQGGLYCWGRAAYRMYGNLSGLPEHPHDAWEDWQYPQRMNPMVSDIVTLAQSRAVVRSDRSLWQFNGYRGSYWMRYPGYAGQILDYEEGIYLLADGVLSGYESSPDSMPARHRFAPGLQRLSGVVELSARNEHACMRINDGRVLCWGRNEWGAAGNFDLGGQCGTEGARWGHCVMTPTEIPGIRDAIKVVTGNYQTCVIRRDGTLWCWGNNEAFADGRGSIGDGRPADETCGNSLSGTVQCRRRPVYVVGLRDVVDVAIATSATCALVASGQVYCWGFNHGGRLAVGTTTDVPLPLPVRW